MLKLFLIVLVYWTTNANGQNFKPQTKPSVQIVHYLHITNSSFEVTDILVKSFKVQYEPFNAEWHAKATWDSQNYNQTG